MGLPCLGNHPGIVGIILCSVCVGGTVSRGGGIVTEK